MSRAGRLVTASAIACMLVVALFLLTAPRIAATLMNPLLAQPTGAPTAAAVALHSTLTVADLHADALLWDRDLLRDASHGHVDVPRLTAGRVAVQAFTVVTKTPADMNIESNSADSDRVTLLALGQLWPARTWSSLTERALHQARKLARFAERSDGTLNVVRTRADLDALLMRHEKGDAVVGGVLGLEGAHALEGDLATLDRLHAAGFRMVGLTHFFDTEVGGSAHGVEKGGLTDFGRRVVERMEALGMAIDLAHASTALIDDVLSVSTTPIVVSHTGVRGTCDNPRNLDDERIRAIARTGGLVAIGLWPVAVCGETPATWARAVRHAVGVAGVDHVALGSDWDGAVAAIVEASGTVHLTAALLDEGFAAPEIRGIMGGNVIRVLRQTLPDGI